MLRTGRGRIKDRRVKSRLILRQQAITAAKYKIVLAKDDVDGSREECRGCDDGAKGEELAERLGLLVGDSDGEVLLFILEGYYDWCMGSTVVVLTIGVKVGPPVVGKLDGLLKWLHQVTIAEASKVARGVRVSDGEIEGCQSRIHKGRRDGGARDSGAARVAHAYDLFKRQWAGLGIAEERYECMCDFNLHWSLDHLVWIRMF